MRKKPLSPLQAAFWLTRQEQRIILVLCALLMLGIAARSFYLKSRNAGRYTPDGIETEHRK